MEGSGRLTGPSGAATGRLGGATYDPGAPILDPKLTENLYRRGFRGGPVSDPIFDEVLHRKKKVSEEAKNSLVFQWQ